MSRGKVPHIVRLMDRDGQYVGLMPLPKCQRMEEQGKLVVHYNGRRTFAQCIQRLDDFERTNQDRPIYHMAESHQGHCLVVVKRLAPDKSYGHRWDPGLTFGELRRGQIISNEAKEIQRAARRHRQQLAAAAQAQQ